MCVRARAFAGTEASAKGCARDLLLSRVSIHNIIHLFQFPLSLVTNPRYTR